jgi:hypothetical protein
MGIRAVAILAISAALCGCSVVRDYVADMHEDDARAFCEAQRHDPAVKPLSGKLPIVNPSEITPHMLAIDAVPTPAEVEAIIALSEDQHACRDKLDEVAKDHWPTQVAMRKSLALKMDLVTAQLIRRKMTYGNANRLYQEAALEAEGQFTADRKEQMDKAREQESLAWRTLGDGIKAIAGTQKPEPTQDPCTWAGNTVDCGGH